MTICAPLQRHNQFAYTLQQACRLSPLAAIIAGVGGLWAMPAQAAPVPVTSGLWGQDGEVWTLQSRLPDFSYAGYHSGEAPLPDVAVRANVRDFGAVGDGATDDTAAFIKALESVSQGALLVPAGTYQLSGQLVLRKSGVVLRGEGADKSILVFTKSLEQLKPHASHTMTGESTTEYSWSGGLISVEGKSKITPLGAATALAPRGSRELVLANSPALKVGQWVQVTQHDTGDKSFINYLYAGQPGDAGKLTWAKTDFLSRVSGVTGNKVTLERPLRLDVDPKWDAKLGIFEPGIQEVGIEKLGLRFPQAPYRGHFKEDGFNAIEFNGGINCWARDLRISNADSGIFLSSLFCTVQNVVLDAVRTGTTAGETGHHGICLGTDNLVRGFDFRTKFVHDISVENTAGSVACDGKGVDLCFDNHKRNPHANLFTAIDIGLGSRMFRSGGGGNLGRNSAAWTTFWNVRAARPQHWPPVWNATGWAPDLINFVGVSTADATLTSETGRWFEAIDPAALQPQNLYDAQLARRLRTAAKAP